MSLEPIDTPKLCPFCGAYSPRSCELIDDAGYCAWQELPSEIEGCLSLLADARARIADLTAEVARKDEALWAALGELYAPEASCSCHISPPCGDCVEYSSIRSTQDLIRAALETKHD